LPAEHEDIVYLDVDDVLVLYGELFGCSVERAKDQLLRPELLESALTRPAHYAFYQGADLALQAAVLAHGVAENQPFVDGNKRTAELAMLTFLDLNGYEMSGSDQDEADLATWILDLSAELTPEGLADRLRPRLARILSAG
jgi:death-on-curing family protein